MLLNNVKRFNLINESNKVKPSYDLTGKETYIELYISKEKLCIIGSLDPNYICWCSITNLIDKENNANIFNHIANSKFKTFSIEYKVLDVKKLLETDKWYHCMIQRASDIKGMLWDTPFGHYYWLENREEHGRSFSNDVITFYDDLIKLCEFRAGGQSYIQMLAQYLELLRKDGDYRYYYEMKPLIEILEKESYLEISPDDKIRKLYLECMAECSDLYNRYMTAVR